MTIKHNKRRILTFLQQHSGWASRREIAAHLGVKRFDHHEVELIAQLEEEGAVETRVIPYHCPPDRPKYEYRVKQGEQA